MGLDAPLPWETETGEAEMWGDAEEAAAWEKAAAARSG